MKAPSIPEAMAKATSHGTWYVTRRQLYQAWAKPEGGLGWLTVFAVAAPAALLYLLPPSLPVLVLIGVIVLGLAWRARRLFVPDEDSFDALLADYRRRYSTPNRLLLQPGLHQPPPPSPEGDEHAHGTAGILLVDDDLLVDLLVRNNQHAALGLAIVSISGYPAYVLPPLQASAPTAKLYVLHGAGTPYPEMAAAAQRLFPGRAAPPNADLGLGHRSAGWITLPPLSRSNVRHVDSLGSARLIALLARAISLGVPLRSAHTLMAKERARSGRRSGFTWEDSGGFG